MKNKNPKNAGRKPDSLLGPRVRLVHKALPEHVDFFNKTNIKRSLILDNIIDGFINQYNNVLERLLIEGLNKKVELEDFFKNNCRAEDRLHKK